MLNVQARNDQLNEARQTVQNLANEFKALIGSQPAPEEPQQEVRSVRLGDYMRERELSTKRVTKKVQLLPQDDQSMIFRKKRDEIIKLLDRATGLLTETRAIVVQHTDLKTLITHETKLRELVQIASHCKVAFRSGMNVVVDHAQGEQKVSTAVTPQQQESIKKAVESIKPQPLVETAKNSNAPRDINELKSIISSGFRQHNPERSAVNIRSRPANKISSVQFDIEGEKEEMFESKMVPSNEVVPAEFGRSGRKKSFAEPVRARAPTTGELKQSLYQPEVKLQNSSSNSKGQLALPSSALKKSLAISIKDSNFDLANRLSAK